MLKLERSEIKRYMQDHSEVLNPQVEAKIDKAIAYLEKEANPKYCCVISDFELQNNSVYIKALDMNLNSLDLSKHLEKCCKVALFVATLGVKVDKQIQLLEFTSMSEAYIFNAVCVEYIEKYCDYVETELQASAKDYFMTSRYSCGYGDLALSHQKEFIQKLNATKLIGVHVLDNYLMIPSKSVSALIGLSNHKVNNDLAKCELCLDNGKCSGQCIGRKQ